MSLFLLHHMLERLSPSERDAFRASLEAWPPLWQMILFSLAIVIVARLLEARP